MAPTEPDAPLIPLSVLFGNPERIAPRLSPDGARLAWLAPDDGVMNVWLATAAGAGARLLTHDRDRGIRMHQWAHDGRHLLYLQDTGGDEDWHVHVVDVTTGADRDVTPFEGVAAQIVAADKHHPDQVLVGLNRDNPQLHDVYRLELASGDLEKVADNPGFVAWVADADLRVRCGVAPTPDGGMTVLVRAGVGDDDEWKPVLVAGQDDALTTAPVGFTADGAGLYVLTSKDANAARLAVLDLATLELRTIAEDPHADVVDAVVHPDTLEVQLVAFQRERREWQAIDPAVEADLQAALGLGAGDLGIVSATDDNRSWVLAFTADDGPVRYVTFDRDTRQGQFLFVHQPELASHQLAHMEPCAITARDGLPLHGYLTFPPTGPRADLPAVLLVHGGPWARDVWGYDPNAQWLANRGYLCVQVNYRGSTGYGKDFVTAGDRQWGAKMHDDLIDAVDHVVAQGWADRSRVGIMGGSYGGYAALVGAAFTPDVFACAVDIVGPSNIATLIASIPAYWAPMVAQFHNRVGNPDTEPDFCWERSPLSKADQIRIPLLIAQGANDPRVKQAESEQIVEALRQRGIDHEYRLYPDEGHGFAKPENRLDFFGHAERFLAKHLGGRCTSS